MSTPMPRPMKEGQARDILDERAREIAAQDRASAEEHHERAKAIRASAVNAVYEAMTDHQKEMVVRDYIIYQLGSAIGRVGEEED